MIEVNQIYNEDCIDFMKKIPNESVDLIIADPPYYKIVKNNWDNQWRDENEYLSWSIRWLKESYRILKRTGTLYMWGGIGRKSDTLLKLKLKINDEIDFIFQDWITWKKQKGLGSRKGYMYIREELLMFTKTESYTLNTPYLDEVAKNHGRLKKGKVNYKRCGNVWVDINEVTVGNLIHTERVKHPTQKPLKACNRIITTSSNEGDLVYIPFAGSGSEIVSCIKNNLNWVATETNKSYIDDLVLQRIKSENLNSEG